VTVNGGAVGGSAVPGSYFTVNRSWRDGDVVRVSLPFRLRVEKTPDDPLLQALFLGPVNLVGRKAATTHLQVGLYRNAALSGDLLPSLTPVAGRPLHYTLDGVEYAPFHEGTEDPTHAYVRRAEPRVLFGGTDSTVANPAKPDGTTLLDEIWAEAPFASKGALVTQVRSTVNAWVSAGLLGRADAQRVVTTAQNASYVA
jgi:hypothetical protein